MKKVLAIIALLLMALPLIAQGAGEVIGGAGAGAATGAAIGSIFPGIGTAIGAVVGTIAGGIAGMFNSKANDKARAAQQASSDAQVASLKLQTDQNYQNNYLSAKSNYESLVTNIDNTKTGIQQASANISSYDQAILRWQDQYDIGKQQIQDQGASDYGVVMNNWMNTAAAGSVRGQSGGTADILAGGQKSQVKKLVGDDMILDANGGTFGTQMQEYNVDTEAQWDELVQQREIEKDALGKYQDALGRYTDAFDEAADLRRTATQDYYNNKGEDGSKAISDLDADINGNKAKNNELIDPYEDNAEAAAEIQRRKKLKEQKS
ncbi:MAG: hypothetical protein WCR70_07370 [Sphaerochaetaceae bacterium]